MNQAAQHRRPRKPRPADGRRTYAGEAGRIRLQKFLSDAGIASRRRAEELVLEGRVLVNGGVVEALPAFVDPARDAVIVDGAPVHVQAPTYYLVHKPKGFVCTNRDPDGRPRAVDLLPPIRERLFPVGRLDADSSGLLLMSNDGELALRITHPRFGIPKRYRVEVRGQVGPEIVRRMRDGVYLAEGKASATEVEVIHRGRERSVLMVTLREGRNRQVRRMLARLGHPVRDLKRVQIGPLSLKGLPLGAARRLSPPEVSALLAAIEHAPADASFAAHGRRRRRRSAPGAREDAMPSGRPPRPAAQPPRGGQRRGGASPPGPRPQRRAAPPATSERDAKRRRRIIL